MNTTNATACNSSGNTCDYCTVTKWTKGDHRAIIPTKWSDLISGEVCNCCIGKNIREADLDVLKSMAGLLSDCLGEGELQKLSFYEACNMFIDIVDDLEGELVGDEIVGNSTTASLTH